MTSLLPKSAFEFSKAEYWDAFFKQRGTRSFEWYGEYPELCVYLHKYMKPKDNILVVGCGNSKLGEDLYDVGYRQITNIDISKTVIKQMKLANVSKRPELIFEEMDATHMSFEAETFSVVFDKGTFDALMPDEEPDTLNNIKKYVEEIDRVMRIGGRYIVVSLLQQHIMSFLLQHFEEKAWMIRVCRCYDVEAKSFKEQGSKSLPVFMVIFTKFKKIPTSQPVFELCLATDAPATRVSGIDKIKESVLESQMVAIVCSGLQRSNSGGREIELEIGKPEDDTPRYTIRIVEKPCPKASGMTYAAFIVPQGRESEWAFGTPEGRQFLLSESHVDRLAVIILNRGHKFTSLEQVKSELNPIIQDFSPGDFKDKISYLSVGGDVGVRNEVYFGDSPISGKFVVEETESEPGILLRRLYFLSSKNAIQSEAKVRKVKTRRGGERVVVDTTSLSCAHHGYMTIGTCSILDSNSPGQLLVVGLGGGALPSFLRKVFPKSVITAVELDREILKVAVNYFGLVEDKQLIVYIKDGLVFIKEAANRGMKYDSVIFDVDNKDVITGLSSPPPEFVVVEVLQEVKNILSPGGIFILNLVCRNKDKRDELSKRLKSIFSTVKALKLDDDLNEIFFCWNQNNVNSAEALYKAHLKLNDIIKHRRLDKLPCVDAAHLNDLLQEDD
ncbi:unnamed protein product [Nezara viridula]|uniref:Methyltransferase type 11 domain-containing protein n=1 Tax=Nezara viridula TaxID=85310 RepID=A0A9P0MHC6_NEZVI|nr:unnamed protein product [Nezara viridula]